MSEEFRRLLDLPTGPGRTAALVAWFQGLYLALGEEPPVLVGGAAVELYTGGAYTTGDLDFVGVVPEAVAERLRAEGFSKEGRHWVHARGEVFIELPGAALAEGEATAILRRGDLDLRLVDPEALVVDRLAAWAFWNSSVDGVAAFRLLSVQGEEIDGERLERLAEARNLSSPLAELLKFAAEEPTDDEVERWASRNHE